MRSQYNGCPHFLCLFLAIFLKLIVWFQCIGYDSMASMDYMDFDVGCPRKAVKFNHILTCILWCLDLTCNTGLQFLGILNFMLWSNTVFEKLMVNILGSHNCHTDFKHSYFQFKYFCLNQYVSNPVDLFKQDTKYKINWTSMTLVSFGVQWSVSE